MTTPYCMQNVETAAELATDLQAMGKEKEVRHY